MVEGPIAAKFGEGAACDDCEGEKKEDCGEKINSGSVWASAENALEVDGEKVDDGDGSEGVKKSEDECYG